MDSLGKNVELACEVVCLAHRFQVGELVDIAASVAWSGVTVANYVGLFNMFKTYGYLSWSSTFFFIAHRLEEVSTTSYFKDIDLRDLRPIVFSTEVIVREMGLYRVLREWLKSNQDFLGTKQLADMFSAIHFELLSIVDLQIVRTEKLADEELLFTSLERTTFTLQASRIAEDWDGALHVPQENIDSSKFCTHYVLFNTWVLKHV